jgi:chromosome segregation ATPase
MWKELVQLGRRLFTLASKVERHEEEIQELRQDLKDLDVKVDRLGREMDRLSEAVHRLALELRHDRERAADQHANLRDRLADQHEQLVLRLDNALLRFERRLLPPATPPDDTEES